MWATVDKKRRRRGTVIRLIEYLTFFVKSKFFSKKIYIAKRIKNTTINVKRAIASVKAKPKRE